MLLILLLCLENAQNRQEVTVTAGCQFNFLVLVEFVATTRSHNLVQSRHFALQIPYKFGYFSSTLSEALKWIQHANL